MSGVMVERGSNRDYYEDMSAIEGEQQCYENIRKALEMGPTPESWAVCTLNNGVFVEVRHYRTTQDVEAEAYLIAACDPDTIRALLEERDALREVLQVLVNWTPSADTYRRLGFNPEVPMRAHDAAKALLAKGNGND